MDSALPLATIGTQESVAQKGPFPIQLVVVMAVKNAVSAATTTFTAISMIRFFIIINYPLSARLCRLLPKGRKNCQLQSLVVLGRPTTALGEGLAGHLAALAVLDGDSLHSSRVAQGERLAVERALSCRCRAIGCVTDPVLLQDCRSDDSG